MARTLTLPGFVNAHSHGFQRALRGRAAGADFWAWRDTMLAEAARQTPETVRETYEGVYREQRVTGYTAVGEFHYLGLAEAHAAAEAAHAAGIELVMLHAAYGRGGLDRFRQQTVAAYLDEIEQLLAAGLRVGLAPHSVRACPRDWLEEIGRYAASTPLPLHVHACEQPREIDECLAEHGLRPIELLADTGCLGPQNDCRPCDTRRRPRARSRRRGRRPRLPLSDHRGRPRRRVRTCRPPARARYLAVHRLGLEHPHRPSGGAAGAVRHRAARDDVTRRTEAGRAPRPSVARAALSPSASTPGPRSTSTSIIRHCAAWLRTTSRPRSSRAALRTC